MDGKSVFGDLYVKKIPTASLPTDDEGISQFLIDLFVEKDKKKQRYLETGTFIDDAEMLLHGPRPHTLLLMITLNTLVGVPLVWYLLSMVFSGSLFQAALAVVLVVGSQIGMSKCIDVTKVSKASDYGRKDK
jgi:hypothetical protein